MAVDFKDFAPLGSVFNSQSIVTVNNGGDIRTWLIQADSSALSGAVVATGISAKEIVGSAYIGVTASSKTAAKIALVISNNQGEVATACVGEAKLANGSTTYYFDISKLSSTVKSSDTLTVSICIIPEGEGEESLEISEISLFGRSTAGDDTVVVIIVVAVILAALGGLIAVLVVNRKKKSRKGDSED